VYCGSDVVGISITYKPMLFFFLRRFYVHASFVLIFNFHPNLYYPLQNGIQLR
jgi:hypothetical protein